MPKVATQWNRGAIQGSNRGHRVRIPSALTTKPLSHYITGKVLLTSLMQASAWCVLSTVCTRAASAGKVAGGVKRRMNASRSATATLSASTCATGPELSCISPA